MLAGCFKGDAGPAGLDGTDGPEGPEGPPGEYDLLKLNAVLVPVDPVADGVVDGLWSTVPALTVLLGETYDVHDPESINDCAGCHAYESDIRVSVKAVYTEDRIHFLTVWNDPTASFTRGNSWVWDDDIVDDNKWNRSHHTEQSEDRMSFFFPMGDITGDPYSTGGCMTKCHIYWPVENDPYDANGHGIVDDAFLETGRADMWHSKGARCAAVISASGIGLQIDPDTYEVTQGVFSMIGYADDKYVDVHDEGVGGEDGGRYGDAGTSTYSHNRIGDKSRPKWIETDPVDYADAMFLLQSEIDGGECVGDATDGVSNAEALLYWPAYVALGAIVPERITQMPDGSCGDIEFGAVWNNGIWTAEFSRDLLTGNDDDVQFDTAQEYPFNMAEFDNSRHGYEHRTSGNYSLIFIP